MIMAVNTIEMVSEIYIYENIIRLFKKTEENFTRSLVILYCFIVMIKTLISYFNKTMECIQNDPI
jgi:hypothetical protein